VTAQTPTVGESDNDSTSRQSDQRDILSLLDDSYTREILTCLRDGPKPARSVVANCDCSRPTVYRRLAQLEETGAVSTTVRYDPDGHHRKRFHLCVDKISIELEDGGILIDIQRS
jgi:predicted transcriptional regulator